MRKTTRAKRLVSAGWPGGITAASATKIDLVDSKVGAASVSVGWRRYLPAARIELSAIKVEADSMP